MGAPVVATGSGTIVSAGWLGGYGKAIVIQHNGVQQTLYGHLSEVFVQPGQQIEQGTVIGRVGSSGNSTGPHLHFETRSATADGWIAVDPGAQVEYALDNLRRSMPFAQRELPPQCQFDRVGAQYLRVGSIRESNRSNYRNNHSNLLILAIAARIFLQLSE